MFRFSIRETMLVTAIVVLVAGWWADRSRLAADNVIWQQRAEEAKVIVEAWFGDEIPWGGPWPLDPKPAPASAAIQVIRTITPAPGLHFPPETDYQHHSSFEQ